MPAFLNNVLTQDTYVDALTVTFRVPRKLFTFHVYNKAVNFQLGVVEGRQFNTLDVQWDPQDRFVGPALNVFDNPEDEGLPPGSLFAGIRIRSAATGEPARVAVM